MTRRSDRQPVPAVRAAVPPAAGGAGRRLVRTAAAALAASLLALASGCTTVWRAYDGEPRPRSEVAVLRLPPDVVHGSVALDDVPSPHRAVTRIEVLPGRYRVSWGYRYHNRFVGVKDVAFTAEPGEELRLAQTFARTAGPLGPVGDATMLAVEAALSPITWLLPAADEPPPGRYHAWIEDPDGTVIAGEPPDLPVGFVEVGFVEVDF